MCADEIRTRRAILGAGLGGIVAAIASGFGAPRRADAANGDRLRIGSTANEATVSTNLNANGASVYGFGVDYSGTGSAIWGNTTGAGTAIRATATGNNGVGVNASGTLYGVSAVGNRPDGIGVRGTTFGTLAAGGIGVQGTTTNAVGVEGTSSEGVGVRAHTSGGGTALSVHGKVKFTRSGRVTIAAGTASKQVSIPNLNAESWVVATLQKDVPGLFVRAVVPTAEKITILLNKETDENVPVGYFVIN